MRQPQQPSLQLSIRVPVPAFEQLRKLAEAEGLLPGQYVRRMIEERFAEEES